MKSGKNLGENILGHLEFYRELGVEWVAAGKRQPAAASGSRDAVHQARKAPGEPPAVWFPQAGLFGSEATGAVMETLDAVREDLGDCRRCKLSPLRKNIVFGSGYPRAELMFVGEAPGADEDEQGLPFVGKAGQLLTKIIEGIQMKREDVYICNILKCRPPRNRDPEPDEISSCQPFLFRQIGAVKPKVICALGTFGAQTLLGTREAISHLRGRFIEYRGAKLMATFHPAYLLRNPAEKRKVWEDMQKIREYLSSSRAGA